eukprot:TRINITY_DN1435_c0_g1_i1.p1 TRINITY_DN1435_c0_g1~~TRINITY_DN1435_c0_g1_i1.p1  ORF type:complete len:1376 (-),score=395.69 TRINITY_DN1435_c0_g1_i1:34-4161(-)
MEQRRRSRDAHDDPGDPTIDGRPSRSKSRRIGSSPSPHPHHKHHPHLSFPSPRSSPSMPLHTSPHARRNRFESPSMDGHAMSLEDAEMPLPSLDVVFRDKSVLESRERVRKIIQEGVQRRKSPLSSSVSPSDVPLHQEEHPQSSPQRAFEASLRRHIEGGSPGLKEFGLLRKPLKSWLTSPPQIAPRKSPLEENETPMSSRANQPQEISGTVRSRKRLIRRLLMPDSPSQHVMEVEQEEGKGKREGKEEEEEEEETTNLRGPTAQSSPSSSFPLFISKDFPNGRYVIVEKELPPFDGKDTLSKPSLILRIINMSTQREVALEMSYNWAICCGWNPGSMVMLIGFQKNSTVGRDSFGKKSDAIEGNVSPQHVEHLVLDERVESRGFAVIHPDDVVSVSRISEGTECPRRPYLSESVNLMESPKAVLPGIIVHELFQTLLEHREHQEDIVSVKWVSDCLKRIVRHHSDDLFLTGVDDVASFIDDLEKRMIPPIIDWMKRNAVGETNRIMDIEDIEHSVFSTDFGMKGKIDASFWINDQNTSSDFVRLHALEIKSGVSGNVELGKLSHRAQLLLYALLLAWSCGNPESSESFPAASLFYVGDDKTIDVRPSVHELRPLVMHRNTLADALHFRTCPEKTDTRTMCQKCFSRMTCDTYDKIFKEVSIDTGDVGSSAESERGLELIRNVWKSLDLEEHEILHHDRHKRQGVIKGLKLSEKRRLKSAGEEAVRDLTEPLLYTFERTFEYDPKASTSIMLTKRFLETTTTVSPGDHVHLSIENGDIAIASGRIHSLDAKTVVLMIDRPFIRRERDENLLYQIDKTESTSLISRMRGNLVFLSSPSVVGRRLFGLVSGAKTPTFHQTVSCRCVSEEEKSEWSGMNSGQREVIQRALCADDCLLVLGMPGTGKSTTIAHLIRSLVRRRLSVLLVAHTHMAVDNILLKLGKRDFSIGRFGSSDRVEPSLRHLSGVPMRDLFGPLSKYPVVAGTTSSINPNVPRTFDYCIIDEASQVPFAAAIAPLRLCHRFILVGDHYQLPPVTRSKQAKMILEGHESLFQVLIEKHPTCVTSLRHQYRMSEHIMEVCNKMVYDGALLCPSDAVRQRKMNVQLPHGTADWIRSALNPMRSVVFLDTDGIPAIDSRTKDGSLVNQKEGEIVSLLVQHLIQGTVDPDDIGVICPLHSQIRLIQSVLTNVIHETHFGNVNVQTVDRFQGRDKECIIFCLVRSNENFLVGDLLKDWKRINVGFTRARSKLIVVGSQKTFQSHPPICDFISLCVVRGWMMSVPENAIPEGFGKCLSSSDVFIADEEETSGGDVETVTTPLPPPPRQPMRMMMMETSNPSSLASSSLASSASVRSAMQHIRKVSPIVDVDRELADLSPEDFF